MFKVVGLNGTLINDLSIAFNGSTNGMGGASTTFSEKYCTIDFNTGCQTFQVNNPPPMFTQHIPIPNASQLFSYEGHDCEQRHSWWRWFGLNIDGAEPVLECSGAELARAPRFGTPRAWLARPAPP